MTEAIQQHTPNETPFDREQVVVEAPASVGESENGITPSALETTLAWQVGQGYGNQLSAYDMHPMTVKPGAEVATLNSTVQGDFSARELSYAVKPISAETMPPLPLIESNEGPAENIFVINADRLASMNETERKIYLREKVAAIYDAKEQMSRQWEEYRQQHENDPELLASIDKSNESIAIIDSERADMIAKAPPEESVGPQAQKALRASSIWDSLYKVGAKFAPQIVLSAAIAAGAVGTPTEAQANPLNDLIAAGIGVAAGRASTEVGIQNEGGKQYGRVGAAHEDRREVLHERSEDKEEKVIEQFNAKKIRFNQQYVRDKQALYDRNATQAQLDVFERVTSENFAILMQQRQEALNATARKLRLAERHDVRAEQREMRGVNRRVGEERGDADTTMTQQGIGVLGQVLQGQIQKR